MTFWEGQDVDGTVDTVMFGQSLAELIWAADQTNKSSPPSPEQSQTVWQQPVSGDVAMEEGGQFGAARDGGARAHGGLDFPVPEGTAVVAMAAGTVTEVVSGGDGGGYGNYVLVDHGDGLVTRYAHLASVTVAVGATVAAGGQLGLSGNTGASSGPHLHFEVLQNGTAVDPAPFLAGGGAIIAKAGGGAISPADLGATLTPETFTGAPPTDLGEAIMDSEQGEAGPEVGMDLNATDAEGGDFFGQVLAGIGAPDTPENRRVLEAWARAEGMEPGHNNPLATTQDAEGASVLNSHGVKHYNDQATGVAATIQTLTNGLYGDIIAALKAGNDAMAVAAAIEASPWGTGGLVRKILEGGPGG